MNNQISAGALDFISLAVSPYAYLTIMTRQGSKRALKIAILALSILVGGFGVWALIDRMFIQTDTKAGVVFIVVPVF